MLRIWSCLHHCQEQTDQNPGSAKNRTEIKSKQCVRTQAELNPNPTFTALKQNMKPIVWNTQNLHRTEPLPSKNIKESEPNLNPKFWNLSHLYCLPLTADPFQWKLLMSGICWRRRLRDFNIICQKNLSSFSILYLYSHFSVSRSTFLLLNNFKNVFTAWLTDWFICIHKRPSSILSPSPSRMYDECFILYFSSIVFTVLFIYLFIYYESRTVYTWQTKKEIQETTRTTVYLRNTETRSF